MSKFIFNNVQKRFATGFRLGPLSLAIEGGTAVALFGQNGSGKTTLFNIATGNIDATSGCVTLGDAVITPDNFMLKRSIGYLPQESPLPRWVSARDFLTYAAQLYELSDGPEAVNTTITKWDCTEFATRPLNLCSYGMQKRVGLAIATIHNPEILILDEPFSGLDIIHIRILEQAIAERTRTGKSTILSTHTAINAAKLCSRALVIMRGSFHELKKWPTASLMERVDLVDAAFFAAPSMETS